MTLKFASLLNCRKITLKLASDKPLMSSRGYTFSGFGEHDENRSTHRQTTAKQHGCSSRACHGRSGRQAPRGASATGIDLWRGRERLQFGAVNGVHQPGRHPGSQFRESCSHEVGHQQSAISCQPRSNRRQITEQYPRNTVTPTRLIAHKFAERYLFF